MSEWSEQLAAKIKSREGKEVVGNEEKLKKEKLIMEQGPALWEQVRSAIKKNCADLNRDAKKEVVIFEVTPQREASVRTNTSGSTFWLRARFDNNRSLTWETNARTAAGGRFDISLDENGKAQFYESTWIPSSPESIAQRMIKSLFE